MDQNNGLEAKISKRETRTTLAMDLPEVPPKLFRISLANQTSHIGTTIRIMKDHMINAQISHLIQAMDIDLEMEFSTIRMGTGETMEIFLVLHRPKERLLIK